MGKLPGRARGGAVTVELIIALPVLVIAIVAVIVFGLLMGNRQWVEQASRAGAEVASVLPTMATEVVVPPGVRESIEASLAQAGIDATVANGNLTIVLETDVGGLRQMTDTNGGPDCDPDVLNPPPLRNYTRVVVCVRSTALAPNALVTFGFDLSDSVARQETTLRYRG